MRKPDEAVSVLMECLNLEKDPANRRSSRPNPPGRGVPPYEDADQAEKYAKEVLKRTPGAWKPILCRDRFHDAAAASLAIAEFRAVVSERLNSCRGTFISRRPMP